MIKITYSCDICRQRITTSPPARPVRRLVETQRIVKLDSYGGGIGGMAKKVKRKLKSHYTVGKESGKKRSPKTLGPCQYCQRFHGSGKCWEAFAERKAARRLEAGKPPLHNPATPRSRR